MRKLILMLLPAAGLCLIFLLFVWNKNCQAESVYSYVDCMYHTDYIKDGEPYRDVMKEETDAANALIEVEKTDGTLSEGSYQTKANAITTYGSHQLYTRAQVTNANKEVAFAYAWSEFEDDWIVRAPAGVTEGQMTLGVTVYGNYEGDENTVYYDFDAWGNGHISHDVENNPTHIDDFNAPSQLVTITINYEPDKFFTIESQAEVTSRAGAYDAEGLSEESYIDFGHTIVITSLTLPEGHTLETASGTTYPLDYTPPGSTPPPADDTSDGSGGGGGGGCFISTISK